MKSRFLGYLSDKSAYKFLEIKKKTKTEHAIKGRKEN